MKARMVRFEKVFNLGNYENARVGIEVELEEGETAMDAMAQAKRFVEAQNPKSEESHERQWAERVLKDPDNHLVRDVQEAQKVMQRQMHVEDFPF